MSWPIYDFSSSPGYQQIFDYAGGTTGQAIYIGWATPGVPTSANKWKIRKLTYDGNGQVLNIQFASGDVGFNFVWDNRTTYTYTYMKKWILIAALSFPTVCSAEQTKTVFNAFTGVPDFITALTTTSIAPGTNITVSTTSSGVVINSSGGGGSGPTGQINNASQNSVPRYSASGSSNALSGSSIATDNGSTFTVTGVVYASTLTVNNSNLFNMVAAFGPTGVLISTTVSGSGTPGGTGSQIQYNNSGSFGGVPGSTVTATGPQISSATIAHAYGVLTINGPGEIDINPNGNGNSSVYIGINTFLGISDQFAAPLIAGISGGGSTIAMPDTGLGSYAGFTSPSAYDATQLWTLPVHNSTAGYWKSSTSGVLTQATIPASDLSAILASTNTWTGGNTFSSVTVSGKGGLTVTSTSTLTFTTAINTSNAPNAQVAALEAVQVNTPSASSSDSVYGAITESIQSGNGSGTSDDSAGINANAEYTGKTTAHTMEGGYIQAQNLSTGTVTSQAGIETQSSASQGGTITNNYGVKVFNYSTGGSTVTNNYGLYVVNPTTSVPTNGLISTNYGLYVEPQTNAKNNYGIYSAGGNNVFVGSTSFSDQVRLSSGVFANGSQGSSGQFLESQGAGLPVIWGTTGGGGSSSLAVTTGTSGGFTSLASSPTAVFNADKNFFSVTLQGAATAYTTIISTGTAGQVLTSNGAGLGAGWQTASGSTVLPSSGIAFGSPSNTVTSDTNSATFNDTTDALSIQAGAITVSSGIYNSSLNKAGFIRVSQHYAYVTGNSSNTLTVFDVSNPTSPVQLTQLTGGDLNQPEGLDIVWPYLYLASFGNNSLLVYDISSPGKPNEIAKLTDSANLSNAEDVHVFSNYAYIQDFGGGSSVPGITIVDVSTPSSPVIVSSVTNGSIANNINLTIRYPYIYTSGGSCALGIINISTPTAPVISTITAASFLSGCSVKAAGTDYYGKYLYVAGYDNNAIYIVDVSTPPFPVFLGSVATGSFTPWTMHVYGNKLIFTSLDTNSVVQYSLANPASPKLLNSVTDSNSLNVPDDLTMNGNYLYTTDHGTLFQHCGFTILNPGAITATTLAVGTEVADELEVFHDIRANRVISQSGIQANSAGIGNLSFNTVRAPGLNTCGDSSHGVSFNATTGQFGCQSITGTTSSPGGSSGNIQYNNSGNFAGVGFMNVGSTNSILMSGSGGLSINGGTSGTTAGTPLNIFWSNAGSGSNGIAIPITIFDNDSSQNYGMQLKYLNPHNNSLNITAMDITADDNGNGFSSTALQLTAKNASPSTALNIVSGDIELNSSAGTSGQCLQTQGSGSLPAWGSCGGGGSGIVSPGTFTWTNNFGLSVSSIVAQSVSISTTIQTGNTGGALNSPGLSAIVTESSTTDQNGTVVANLADMTNTATSSGTSRTMYGTDSIAANNSSNPWGIVIGALGIATNNSTNTLTSAYGTQGIVHNNTTGKTLSAYDGYFQDSIASGGTTVSRYGVYIDSPIVSGGGHITTNYGLYVQPQTSGDSNYGIYSAGGNNVFVGSTTFSGVSASTISVSSITIGNSAVAPIAGLPNSPIMVTDNV